MPTPLLHPDVLRLSRIIEHTKQTYGADAAEMQWTALDGYWQACADAPLRARSLYVAGHLLRQAHSARADGYPALASSWALLAEVMAKAWADEQTATTAQAPADASAFDAAL